MFICFTTSFPSSDKLYFNGWLLSLCTYIRRVWLERACSLPLKPMLNFWWSIERLVCLKEPIDFYGVDHTFSYCVNLQYCSYKALTKWFKLADSRIHFHKCCCGHVETISKPVLLYPTCLPCVSCIVSAWHMGITVCPLLNSQSLHVCMDIRELVMSLCVLVLLLFLHPIPYCIVSAWHVGITMCPLLNSQSLHVCMDIRELVMSLCVLVLLLFLHSIPYCIVSAWHMGITVCPLLNSQSLHICMYIRELAM